MKLDLTRARPRLDLHSPDLRLTQEQRQALAIDREVVVTAGAGAGKTHVLSLRYVALLLELAAVAVESDPRRPRPRIASVLVLTFTEKAAEEMAERCYRVLLRLSREVRQQVDRLDARYGTGYGGALATAVDSLCDSFPRGQISTFHSFCARLLREYPSETGVRPGFTVLDPVQARSLRDQVLEDALRTCLDTPDLPAMLDAFGSKARVLQAGRIALESRAELSTRLESYARGRVWLDSVLERAPLSATEAREWLGREGLPIAAALCKLTRDGRFARKALSPLLARAESIPTDPLKIYGLYRSMLSSLLTADGSLRQLWHHTVIGTAASWSHRGRYEQAKRALQRLSERCADWPERHRVALELPTAADAAMLASLGAFSRYVLQAERALQERFHDRGALDFAELQLRAVSALDDEAFLQTLQQRYRYLMIDEFQDTNRLQLELVLALGRPGGAPSDRVFLVGDVKQAIYGFRGGDVTVFDRAVNQLGVTPVVLPHNFRSKPQLIRWFNAAFSTILGTPGGAHERYEAPYTPLRAGRSDPGGQIHLILGDASTASFSDQASATARWIATEWLPDYENRSLYPSPPIAILLRARTHLPSYEAALRDLGIPYAVAGGVGFWERPEVLDLVNILHGLCHEDPLSLVGALRSPLLAVPDDRVQQLCRGELHLSPLTEALRVESSSIPCPDLEDVAARWARWQQLRHHLGSSELLARVLADSHGPLVHATSDPSGQAAANVRQLLSLAHELDTAGWSPEQVATQFLEQVLAEERLAEAPIEPGAARVVLLTVHAAKGLEFPAVVVPELEAHPPSFSAPLLVRRLDADAWDLACRVLDPDAAVQTRVRPGSFAVLDAIRRSEERAERARLLYVAVTRARDRLALVGAGSPRAAEHPSTWMQLLEAHHGWPAEARDGLEVVEIREVLEREGTWCSAASSRTALPAPEPLSAQEDLELSPSSLDRFPLCPARWFRTYRLGLPEPRGPRPNPSHGLAAARGELLHQILEEGAFPDPPALRERWQSRVIQQGYALSEAEQTYPELTHHLAQCRDDLALGDVLAARGWPEVPVLARHESVILRGQIDRLYHDGTGWVVLDYKSDRLQDTTPAALAAKAGSHRSQLLAYAWAASKVLESRGQAAVTRGRIYFTAVGAFVDFSFARSDFDELEQLLTEVARVARLDWAAVEAEATASPRPCHTCPLHGVACRGAVHPTSAEDWSPG